MRIALCGLLLFVLIGCAAPGCIVIGTGTTIGLSVSNTPGTGIVDVTFGYRRAEVAVVPVQSASGETHHPEPSVDIDLDFTSTWAEGIEIGQHIRTGKAATQ